MDGFKIGMLTGLLVAVILFNAQLLAKREAVKFYAHEVGDGWMRACYYYTPVTIFSERVDLAGECPARIRAPGSRS